MKQTTKIFLFAVLGSVVVGLLLGPGQDNPPESIAGKIEGEYNVAYYDPTTETTYQIGILSIRYGTYVFIQEEGVEIPEHMVEQIPFIRSTGGTYEINYDFEYQPSNILAELKNGEPIAEIEFKNEIPSSFSTLPPQFILEYSSENELAISVVLQISGLEVWDIVKLAK